MTKTRIGRTEKTQLLLRENEESVNINREHPTDSASLDILIAPGIVKDNRYKHLNNVCNIFCYLPITNRDLRPGAKNYHLEMLGVPLKFEFDPYDIDSDVVMSVTQV